MLWRIECTAWMTKWFSRIVRFESIFTVRTRFSFALFDFDISGTVERAKHTSDKIKLNCIHHNIVCLAKHHKGAKLWNKWVCLCLLLVVCVCVAHFSQNCIRQSFLPFRKWFSELRRWSLWFRCHLLVRNSSAKSAAREMQSVRIDFIIANNNDKYSPLDHFRYVQFGGIQTH